jgi:hypothetical protein
MLNYLFVTQFLIAIYSRNSYFRFTLPPKYLRLAQYTDLNQLCTFSFVLPYLFMPRDSLSLPRHGQTCLQIESS